eukprot:TRINITY_DN16978_c0_g3_i1.p1 TRINITY_DN16978_c0_g3~~TRINITY_DN16978_c0_g3_i1.p1  ORF type:complete len:336 (-),score=41.94 TRINITY_DN16978_c0_g3_i1:92-1099(-)
MDPKTGNLCIVLCCDSGIPDSFWVESSQLRLVDPAKAKLESHMLAEGCTVEVPWQANDTMPRGWWQVEIQKVKGEMLHVHSPSYYRGISRWVQASDARVAYSICPESTIPLPQLTRQTIVDLTLEPTQASDWLKRIVEAFNLISASWTKANQSAKLFGTAEAVKEAALRIRNLPNKPVPSRSVPNSKGPHKATKKRGTKTQDKANHVGNTIKAELNGETKPRAKGRVSGTRKPQETELQTNRPNKQRNNTHTHQPQSSGPSKHEKNEAQWRRSQQEGNPVRPVIQVVPHKQEVQHKHPIIAIGSAKKFTNNQARAKNVALPSPRDRTRSRMPSSA